MSSCFAYLEKKNQDGKLVEVELMNSSSVNYLELSFDQDSFTARISISTRRGTGKESVRGNFKLSYREFLKHLPLDVQLQLFTDEIERRRVGKETNPST